MEKLLSDQEPAVGESSASWSNPNPNPTSVVPMDDFDWSSIRDDDIMQQHSAIRAEEAVKVPFVGDKEPLSSLAAEFQSGNPILKEKIKLLGEQYGALRRTRGDGNCFYRSFMFSYLEHILETQDKVEVDRILENIEECKKTLQGLGYIEFTFEDFFSMQSSSYFFCHYQVFCWFLATSSTICICRCILHAHEIFIEQLESVLLGNETSISHEELLQRSRDQMISDYVVMFFRFVTSGEIRKRSEFFEPFIAGLTNSTVDQVHRDSQVSFLCFLQGFSGANGGGKRPCAHHCPI
ncbi:OVARIAN TUMOR DOMAIN-containing deubiquitinating enzyme 1 isoform X3 [Elaeis guineensis]|uniref:OVARIAN TUMOR DOMAIN-containing deubiquitinating enzyme 1 isoform X3 n=1 Tax=Elaeis guineensis var. tenera TaxID=51953 RepID=UPI003C6CFCAF